MHGKLNQAVDEIGGESAEPLGTGTGARESLDEYLRIATLITESPIGLVSVLDGESARLGAVVGLPVTEAVHDLAARVAIDRTGPVVVADTTLDARLSDQALVVGAPGLRFCVRVPILGPDGALVGTLSVFDTRTRGLTPLAARTLEWLGRDVGVRVDLFLTGPAPHAASTDTEIEGLSPQDDALPTEGPRVLVVDDNSINQKVAARMLERLGCRVEVAADGQEALDSVRRLRFHLVFMDCMMPVMDGYKATAAIRALPGARGKTPVVAMTANAMQGDRERCIAAGMDDYLSKPVHADQLRAAVARWARFTGADPVDRAILEGFRQLQQPGEPDVVNEFIDLFLGDLPARRAAIVEALAGNDLDQVRSAAHALKSSAAYIGAGDLARLCGEMEDAARRENDGRTATLARPLLEEADRVGLFLQTQRRSAGV